MGKPTRVLFVCLGNICRSPTAEGVFRRLVEDAGLSADFEIDSAGTGSWHVGHPPDSRMASAAAKAGYPLNGKARQVGPEDIVRFDHVLAMDSSNLSNLERMATPEHVKKVRLFRDHDPEGAGQDVPDPYYGGLDGFEEVVRIVERTSRALLTELRKSK